MKSDEPESSDGGERSSPMDTAPLPAGWGVPWALALLAGPIIATMISRTVMSFADFVMVSKLGDEAMAAVMPAGISVWCLVCFGFGVVTVTNTFVSQSLGKGELSECSRYTWQGLYVAALLGVIVLPVWWLAPSYFAFAGHPEEVQRLEVIYFRVSLFGIMPAVAANVVANFFNGIHKPSVGLFAAVTANSFNILGNYVLIFGKFGFPELGIAGAAWATAASSTLQVAILAAVWLGPRYAKQFASRATWRPNVKQIRRIFRVGLPVGLHWESDILGFTVFTVFMVGSYGTAQLAANNLAFKFLEVAFMPVVGLSIALTAAVGKAIGRGRPDYARLAARWAIGAAFCYMAVIASAYLVFRYRLPGLLTDDTEVIQWAAKLLVLCAAFQLFDAFGITMTGALRGAGDTFWPGMTTFLLTTTVFMGGGFAMMKYAPGLESIGPWLAATAFICIYGMVMAVRWWYGPWEKIDLFKDEKTPDVPAELVVEPA
ncbi:MAG: MATE family efflux transporter [Phycisphaerales bacterium JB063]